MTANAIRMREARAKETEAEAKRSAESRAKGRERLERVKLASGIVSDTFGAASKAAGAIGALNDPSWYNKDPRLVKDAASISYGLPLGTKYGDITISQPNYSGIPNATNLTSTAGVGSLTWVPTIGTTTTGGAEADPINVAAKNIYAYVRHANSGSANYDAPDLMEYVYSLDSAYYMHSWGIRLYSVLLEAKSENRYYPLGILLGMGINQSTANALIANLSRIRTMLNSFARRINVFNVPKNYSLFSRHYWMNSNIFKDEEIKKSKVYLFCPQGYFLYAEETGELVFNNMPDLNTENPYETLVSMYENIYASIVSSESINIMSGDILKAYGEGNLFKIPEIEEQFHVESIYSPEVLSQISSATIFPRVDVASLGIHQSDAGILWQGDIRNVVGYGRIHSLSRKILPSTDSTIPVFIPTDNSYFGYIDNQRNIRINSYKDDVTPDDTMVASRLTIASQRVIDNSDNPRWISVITACGSEIITKFEVVYNAVDNSFSVAENFANVIMDITGQASNQVQTDVFVNDYLNNMSQYIALVSQFEWHPKCSCGTISVHGEFPDWNIRSYMLATQDVANFALIDQATLNGMHSVALLSELDIPVFGVSQKR